MIQYAQQERKLECNEFTNSLMSAGVLFEQARAISGYPVEFTSCVYVKLILSLTMLFSSVSKSLSDSTT